MTAERLAHCLTDHPLKVFRTEAVKSGQKKRIKTRQMCLSRLLVIRSTKGHFNTRYKGEGLVSIPVRIFILKMKLSQTPAD